MHKRIYRILRMCVITDINHQISIELSAYKWDLHAHFLLPIAYTLHTIISILRLHTDVYGRSSISIII